jgi:hypothetical protein
MDDVLQQQSQQQLGKYDGFSAATVRVRVCMPSLGSRKKMNGIL